MTYLCSPVLKALREYDNRTATEQLPKIKSGKQKVDQASEEHEPVTARDLTATCTSAATAVELAESLSELVSMK